MPPPFPINYTYMQHTMLLLVQRGAEADIYMTEWYGRPAMAKVRPPKPYRNAILDDIIRRRRTAREVQMLHAVKLLGVAAPLVYFVNAPRYSIIMDYIEGTTLHSAGDGMLLDHCKQAGCVAGLLHSAGIMHGDMTTSNFILAGDRLHLIDMGLSRRTTKAEDWAVDLRLVKEIMTSAHAPTMPDAWNLFLEGYSQTMKQYRWVLDLVAIIESRGRYARVV